MIGWTTVYKFTFVLFVALGFVALVCVFFPKYAEYRSRQVKKGELKEEILTFEEECERSRRSQELLATDPSFIEKTAREIGMAKSNETVFKLDDNVSETTNESPR